MKKSTHPGFAMGSIAAALAAAFGTVALPAAAQLPTGATVAHGTAGIATRGSQMTVTNSPNAVLNWQSFSIGEGNSVRFEQADASSKVLNRVAGNDPSNILGSLSSNGRVWLVNPHGVLFGAHARVDVGGLVASSLAISNDDFLAGRFRFDGSGRPGGQVRNQGELGTSFGGHVILLGDTVRNEGLIRSPGGHVVLAAGNSVELVDSGAPNVAVRVTAPHNEALNLGTLLAPGGGSIDIHGGIVNQQGIVRADSVGTAPSGRIVIKAEGDVQLAAGSETSAGSDGAGKAGKVLVESVDGATLVQGHVGATSSGGAGGQVHLLGKEVAVFGQAIVDASGATGGGEILAGGDYQGANPAVKNAAQSYLGSTATVKASATGKGDGGRIVFWGDDATRVYGSIQARGGALGGNGGFAETSGHTLDARPARIDLAASNGKPGTWLLDPWDLRIVACCSQEDGTGIDDVDGYTITSIADKAVVEARTIVNVLSEGVNVTLRTGANDAATQKGDIVVEADIITHTSGDSGATLTLEAHNDIVMNPGVQIAAESAPLHVALIAGSDDNGAGSVRLEEGARILTRGGDLSISAASAGEAPTGAITLKQNSRLDAGGSHVAMTTSTLDMQDGSRIDAGEVALTAGDVRLDRARITAAGQNYSGVAISANDIVLEGGTIRALLGDEGSEGSAYSEGAYLSMTADRLEMRAGSELQAGSIAATIDDIRMSDSQLIAGNTHDGSIAITSGNLTLDKSTIDLSVPDAGPENFPGISITSNNLEISDGHITALSRSASTTPWLDLVIWADDIKLRNASLNAAATGPANSQDSGTIVVTSNATAMVNSSVSASGGVYLDSARFSFTDTSGEALISGPHIRLTSDVVELDHARLDASASESALRIDTGRLINDSSQLSAPNGRWLVRLRSGSGGFPAADLGGLDYTFVQVNYDGESAPAIDGVGRHGILMGAPLDVRIKVNATRPYDGTRYASFTDALSSDILPGFQVQPRTSSSPAPTRC